MTKGTPSMGMHSGKKTHIMCRRCGGHTYHKKRNICSSCGFGRSARMRSYNFIRKK